VKIKTHATIKSYGFCEEARVNFDLLWNYLAGGVSFLPIRDLKDRAYEESASIEIDPVGIARYSSNENPYLNYSAN
jgi:hypothetical protein